jgi:hypothetical protein
VYLKEIGYVIDEIEEIHDGVLGKIDQAG